MDEFRRKRLEGSGGLTGDAPLDPATGLPVFESPLDYEVSKGNMWAFSQRILQVAVNGYLYVQINTGAKPVKTAAGLTDNGSTPFVARVIVCATGVHHPPP